MSEEELYELLLRDKDIEIGALQAQIEHMRYYQDFLSYCMENGLQEQILDLEREYQEELNDCIVQ